MTTQDKYLIKHKDANNMDIQTLFVDWYSCAFFVHLLDERKLTYKVYEKQQNVRYTDGRWVEIVAEKGE